MALITDPDLLSQGTEVVLDTSAATYELVSGAGNLSDDGVLGKTLYSWFKEEWKDDPALIKFDFPMLAITPEQFEVGNNGSAFSDWRPLDDSTRKLKRTAGWREYDAGGTNLREYAGVITLGTLGATDQAYFEQVTGTPVDFDFQGPVNEAIQVYGDINNGAFDYRSNLSLFAREQASVYASSNLVDIGVPTMTYQVYRFPLANGADLKITATDIEIDATGDGVADVAPYDAMSITYIEHANRGAYADATVYAPNDVIQDVGDSFGNGADRWYITALGGTSSGANASADGGVTDWAPFAGERLIGADYSAFGVVIDGNSATAEQIYNFVQWSLRQNIDIDAGTGTVIGQTGADLLVFVGDTLQTIGQPDGDGVFIDGFDSNDTNRLSFTDDSGITRTFPFVAAGSIQPNNNLQADAVSKYFMFFEYTTRSTGADVAVTAASGSAATLTSATTDLSVLTVGGYYDLGGFVDDENNGIVRVVGTPTATSADVVSDLGATFVDEPAGATVTIDANPINSADGILVQDTTPADITGLVSAASSIPFDFDYDGNVQGGRTAGTDAPIVIRALGLDNSQFVEAKFTIGRASGQNFPLVAALERNYENPV